MAAKQPVDVLVNNAGIIYTSLFQMTPVDKMKEVFEINFFSQMALTQSITRIMTRQKGGSIINISSSAAFEGNEGRTAYASSKAAMICSTKVMARELGGFNIRVNAIAPGLTNTNMMVESTAKDALESTLQRTCMKRVGRPEEIANAVLFLASDLSSYLTGQVYALTEACKMESREHVIWKIEQMAKRMRKNILDMALSAGASSSHLVEVFQ